MNSGPGSLDGRFSLVVGGPFHDLLRRRGLNSG
jgi:hypothetical protein